MGFNSAFKGLKKMQRKLTKKLKRSYAEHAVSMAQVFRWDKAFLDGCESVTDEPRSRRLHFENGRKCDQSVGSPEV